MDSRESVGVRNPVTRRDCDGYVLSARTTRGLSMVHSLFLGLMQSHPAPAQKSDPKKEPSNGLPISPTICLPLYTATIGIGLAGNCVDVEVPIEAPDDSKDRFSFVSPRSPSPSGGRVYCMDPLEGESADVLGYTPPLPNPSGRIDEEDSDPGGREVE